MAITTLTSREFHQDSARVKRAAQSGPVIITDRGKPSLVVQRYEDFQALAGDAPMRKLVSIAEALYKPGADEIELELPERAPYRVRDIDW